MFQVTYTDRKGTGYMRTFADGDKAAKFIERLKTSATVKNSDGAIVGEVHEIPRHERIGNRKWSWWIDTEPDPHTTGATAMTLTNDQIKELATQLGFIAGADAGYSQPGLWTKDSTGGGHVDVYPFRDGWTVAFFGPGASIPHSGKFFHEADRAFRYATR